MKYTEVVTKLFYYIYHLYNNQLSRNRWTVSDIKKYYKLWTKTGVIGRYLTIMIDKSVANRNYAVDISRHQGSKTTTTKTEHSLWYVNLFWWSIRSCSYQAGMFVSYKQNIKNINMFILFNNQWFAHQQTIFDPQQCWIILNYPDLFFIINLPFIYTSLISLKRVWLRKCIQ